MNMINKDEPLPDHTKKDYYECYAKIVLEELYPEEFVNLKIEDKPDLQTNDGKWGVEVTNAKDQDQINAESLYVKISYNKIRDKTKALKIIKRCGCKIEGGILSGKVGTDSFDLILSAFDKKLNLLNGKEYRYFSWNCLFIFSYIYANNEMIMKAIQNMQQKQIDIEKKFYKVFVLVPGNCFCLNLYAGSYEIYPIGSNTQVIQASMARELVKKYEKMK